MSRIAAGECSALDMEWYGVDRRGSIAVFCSAGMGDLPEFVCEDRERAEALIDYFGALEKTTGSILLFPKIESADRVARAFADRGLYYFDADNGTEPGVCMLHRYYTRRACPQAPLRYGALPEHIQELLRPNFMDIEDFAREDRIHVKHAYG